MGESFRIPQLQNKSHPSRTYMCSSDRIIQNHRSGFSKKSESHQKKKKQAPPTPGSRFLHTTTHPVFFLVKKIPGTFLAKTYQECCWANLQPAAAKSPSGNRESFRLNSFRWFTRGTGMFTSMCFFHVLFVFFWFLGPIFVTPKCSGHFLGILLNNQLFLMES